MNIRIIARLDIKGPNLVKGIHLEGLRVLGKPERFARYYYENGADELLYMDVVASLYGRNSLLDIVKRTSREIFIPLTVGGGIRTLDDIQAVLRAGADKVSLNTAAIAGPEGLLVERDTPGLIVADLDLDRLKVLRETKEDLVMPKPYRTIPGLMDSWRKPELYGRIVEEKG